MNLDNRDLELLRLAGKYRWLPMTGLDKYGDPGLCDALDVLSRTDYVSVSRDSIYLKPSRKGFDYLEERGFMCDTAARRAYANSTTLRRRLEASRIMLTCLRAGIDTLPDNVDSLGNQPVFLPSFELRDGAVNVMSNATCSGFGHFGNRAYMFHYVSPLNLGMYLINELGIFHRLSSVFAESLDTPQALLFAGTSYKTVHGCLSGTVPSARSGKRGFADFHEVYRRTELPIHLLSCDETGAMQLALMRQPDYNARVARAAYKTGWSPYDEQIPFADGSVKGDPLIIAADMNLRRVRRVVAAARRRGRKRIMVAAFQSQLDSFIADELAPGDDLSYFCIDRPILDAAFPGEFSGFTEGDDDSG